MHCLPGYSDGKPWGRLADEETWNAMKKHFDSASEQGKEHLRGYIWARLWRHELAKNNEHVGSALNDLRLPYKEEADARTAVYMTSFERGDKSLLSTQIPEPYYV